MEATSRLNVTTRSSGLGLEAQRAAIAAECERRGWALMEVFEDAGASGKSMRGRPALELALDAVQKGRAGALVVAAPMWLGRHNNVRGHGGTQMMLATFLSMLVMHWVSETATYLWS